VARHAFFSWDSRGGLEIASDEGWFEFMDWVETLPPGQSECLRELYGEYSAASPSGLEKELNRHVRTLADGSMLKSIADALLGYLPSRPDDSDWLCVWDGQNWVFDRSPEHTRFWDKSVKVSLVLVNDAAAAADKALESVKKAEEKATKRKRSDADSSFGSACEDAQEVAQLLGFAWAEYANDTAVESVALLDDCWQRIRQAWKITRRVQSYLARTEKKKTRKPSGKTSKMFRIEGPLKWARTARARAREAGRFVALAEVAANEAKPHLAADRLQKSAARACSALRNAGESWGELPADDYYNPCSAEEIARAVILLNETWASLSETFSALTRLVSPASPSQPRKRRTQARSSDSAPADNRLYSTGFWVSEFGDSLDSDERLWGETGLDPEDEHTWLDHLDDLASLETAKIDGSICNDDILRSVGRLKHLRSLDLSVCEYVTPEGLRGLDDLKSLEALTMCDVEDSDMASTWPTDSHLEALPDFPKLWYLNLNQAALTESGLEQLARFPGLRALILDGCEEVTDETVKLISTFRHMRWLSLQGCINVTDRSLEYLAGLDNLQELMTERTNTSVRALARLRALLPQCKVNR
jgi:hypothetical protein